MTEAQEMLSRLHEDLKDLKREIHELRADMYRNMIDTAVMKTKLTTIAAVAALAASAIVQWLSRVFF